MMSVVALEGDLTIFTVLDTKPQLLDWLNDDDVVEVDLSNVGELDTAGFQLLLTMYRSAEKQGKPFRYVNMSEPVAEVVSTFGFEERFVQGV